MHAHHVELHAACARLDELLDNGHVEPLELRVDVVEGRNLREIGHGGDPVSWVLRNRLAR